MSSKMYAGQPLTKQISQSLVAPTTLTGFEKFFRQNSNREDGWITAKFNNEEKWQNKFFVFENGVLSYADSEYSEPTSIPMDQVVSFKTDVSHAEPIILITTTTSKLKLKLTSTSEMHKWLFCFQKSVALVLTQLMSTGTSRSPSEWGHGNQNTLPSPERLAQKNPQHNSSSGWLGPQSLHPGSGVLSSDEVYAAFRRNDSRSQLPFRSGDRRSPTDNDFRHSDTAGGTSSSRDSPSKGLGSSAIPIHLSAHSGGSGSHAHHGHGHSAHSHHSHGAHSSHSHTGRSRAHSGLRSVSQDGFGSAGGRGESVDKVATSYKEDAEDLCLEDLLHTPSEGNSSRSRSRADSGDQPSNESEDGDLNGDWRSKSSNELDMEDEMMFDLDETAESRASMISESNNNTAANKLSSSGFSQQSQSRAHSSESTGPAGHGDSFYSFGKALSLSLSLAAPDQHKSPSRRSSHTSHSSMPTGAASPKAAGHSAPRQNHSQYLMWESGFCSKVGIRDSQEDRFACNPNINEQIRQAASSSGAVSGPAPVQSTVVLTGAASSSAETGSGPSVGLGGGVAGAGGYFGVYDGHGGQQAAIYLEKYLLDNICLHPEFTDNIEKAVVDSCIRTDKDFLAECDARRIYCGTTALGAFLIGSSLLVFNIGDCQAVLCSNGQAVEMNSTHKPGRQDETDRIQRAGGWITEEKELYMYRLHRMDLSDPLVRDKANQISWVTINRVCGEISVSRSIGDPDYKRFVPGSLVNSPFNWPDQHDQIFHADLLIPDPECRLHDIGPGDEFLVLASDGLWDVVSPDEAVKMIRAAFAVNKSPSEAAEELCELSIKLGSSDNVTIVITRFLHSSTSQQTQQQQPSSNRTTALPHAAAKNTAGTAK